MTHTHHYLPEGNEITRRKSNPERRSLIVDEDTELQLPGGGYLGGSFIALGKAGWGWTLASFYLEGYPGETGFFRITGKGIPGPFCATSSFTNHGRGKDTVKVEEREASSCSGLGTILVSLQMDTDGKMEGKCLLVPPILCSPTENTGAREVM